MKWSKAPITRSPAGHHSGAGLWGWAADSKAPGYLPPAVALRLRVGTWSKVLERETRVLWFTAGLKAHFVFLFSSPPASWRHELVTLIWGHCRKSKGGSLLCIKCVSCFLSLNILLLLVFKNTIIITGEGHTAWICHNAFNFSSPAVCIRICWMWMYICSIWTCMYCGSLNVFGPRTLIWSGTLRRCGFVDVGVILLEDVCYCVVDFEASCTQDTTQCVRWFPVAYKM